MKFNIMNSLFFVVYQLLWISWVKVKHVFKSSTKYKFSIRLYADFGETLKSKDIINCLHKSLVPRKIDESKVIET